jgi:hypothetical protein
VKLSLCSDGLRAGRLGFDSRQGQEISLFSTTSRLALGPTKSPIQWVPGVRQPRRTSDQSPPSSAKVKNCGTGPPLPLYITLAYLLGHRVYKISLFAIRGISFHISVCYHREECRSIYPRKGDCSSKLFILNTIQSGCSLCYIRS